MNKQDIRLRNRVLSRRAIQVRKKIISIIDNQVVIPFIRNIKRFKNLDQSDLLTILNSTISDSDLERQIAELRYRVNMNDIELYARKYLNELNRVYEKEKKKKR